MTRVDEKPQTRTERPWVVLAVLCLGFFMILLDTTIVNIAVPALNVTLQATLDQDLWIINGYTLAYAALLITGGRLGDLFGPKRLFLVGLTVFTLASVLCGLAQAPGQLIATRVLQGVGGALLTPQTLALLTLTFPADRRGAAFGVWGSVAGLATIAGPTVGGWLVTDLSWRWIFYVNLPIGLATLVLAVRLLPDVRLNRPHRMDWPGIGLASLGLFGVCFGLIERAPWALAGGVAVLAMFAWQQVAAQDREPLVPAGVFADRNFAVMSGVIAAISFGMLGLFLPLVIFLQSVLSLTAFQAGLVLAPMSLASVAAAPFAGRLADRYGGRDILVTGLALWAGGIGLVLWATRATTERGELISGLVIAGFGLGMTFAPLQSLAMRQVAPQLAGSAAGLLNTMRQLGALLGSAAVGAMLQWQLGVQLGRSAAVNADALPQSFRAHFVEGFAKAASGGGRLEVGTGQTGSHLPADLPASVRPAIEQVALKTFHDAYVPAMRATLLLPLIVLAVAVLVTLVAARTDTPSEDLPQ